METVVIGALLLLASTACADPFPTTYDPAIRDAWEIYHPGDDWKWWKAQLWQESRLDPNAVSPAGATGIAQFMRGTAAQYGLVDRRMAEPSILAGARMMRDGMKFWKAPRTHLSRRRLAQAGYNCGHGNLVRAQKLCRGAMEYEPLMDCLPNITGRFAAETLGYAPRIEKHFLRMQ